MSRPMRSLGIGLAATGQLPTDAMRRADRGRHAGKSMLYFETLMRPGGRVLPGAASLPYRSIGVLEKNFQKFFHKWLGKILTIPLILFALDSSLPFSLRASLVRAGPRSFTVQTFGLLIPARTLW